VIAAALAVGGWFSGGNALVASFRTRNAVQRLIEAAPRRLPVARFTALAGISSVRAGVVTRGRGDDEVVLQARVGDVLSAAESAPAAVKGSASAVALVMSRKWRAAVRELETAVSHQPNDAALWSDLAAARHVRSLDAGDDFEGLLSALVAADRSLQLDPQNTNALFNRALILDGLGLRTFAADAWHAYLDVEEDPIRAADARQRLAADEPETWTAIQPDLERAVVAGETPAVEAIVSRFPQDARAYGDVMYLTYWANAYLGGDAVTAAKNLRIARSLGAALSARGETLLAEAVAVIDAAGEGELRTLALAQQAYDHGRDAYRDGENTEAEHLFNDAAVGFAQGHSPMELAGRAYTAFVIFEQGRTQEGHEAMRSVAQLVRAHPGQRALLAFIQWVDGRCELIRGHYDNAMAALDESRAIFVELGEVKNAGAIDGLLAESFQLMGHSDLAWEHCGAAFRGVSEAGNWSRLEVAISGAVRIAMWTQSWDAAASLLQLELAIAPKVNQPWVVADAWRRLYVVQNERKQLEERNVALAQARITAAHAGEEAQQRLAEIDEAEAVVTMQNNPARAVDLLGRALDFAVAKDRRIFVADLLRKRARAQLASGDRNAAWMDLAAGVEELERQRGDIQTLELRARFFDAANALFADAIAFQAGRGDAAAAFRYADRARARSLLDVDGGTPAAPPEDVPAALAGRLPDATLVEFAVLDREVIVFCVRDGGVSMHRSPIAAAALNARIDAFDRLMTDGTSEQLRSAASELYDVLFGGVADRIASATSLVIVPDGKLQRLPFSALWQSSTRQYLAQTYAISNAPSAALLTTRTAPAHPHPTALLVGNAAGNEDDALGYLSNVEQEISSLRRIYRSSRVLLGREASMARFAAEANAYDVIHFAGHGLSDDESLSASLLFARTPKDTGRMYMTDIAKLRLPRAPLVVLAACGTLRGRAVGVEGMPSLARSFLAAGASTVIGTVRDVDDATSGGLLASFHRSIVAGDSPAAALRKAQLDAIARGGADAEPKNWAPYVVYTATP
jgi:CHAT domain-containing protein